MKKLLLVLSVVAMASFLLVGCLPTTNTAPVITSTPGLTATVGTEYTYTVTATDADGDTLTYSVSPSDLAIAANVITWTPTAAGTMDVIVTVTDGTDPVTQSFTITVSEPPEVNVAPVITSTAVLTATVGLPYVYTVAATDANVGDVLTYSLTTNVAGMGIDSATGLITWTPTFAASYTVGVMVSDGALTATESFTVVASDPVVPVLTATIWYNPTHSYEGTYTYVRGYAVAADAVPVKVTLSEALATGEYIKIRWNDGTFTSASWTTLTQVGTTLEYTGTLKFDPTTTLSENGATCTWTDCKLVCVEVAKADTDICPACDPVLILNDTVKVDSVDPYLDLDIVFSGCDVTCEDPGLKFTFKPNTYNASASICNVPCCGDVCSGIDGWTIEDAATCPECVTLTGTTCVAGTYACGCLLFADGHDDWTGVVDIDEEITYNLKFTFADNVGNAIVDTWTITLDTDSVVSFTNTNTLASPVVVSGTSNLGWDISYTSSCTAAD